MDGRTISWGETGTGTSRGWTPREIPMPILLNRILTECNNRLMGWVALQSMGALHQYCIIARTPGGDGWLHYYMGWNWHRDFTWPSASWNPYANLTEWNTAPIHYSQGFLLLCHDDCYIFCFFYLYEMHNQISYYSMNMWLWRPVHGITWGEIAAQFPEAKGLLKSHSRPSKWDIIGCNNHGSLLLYHRQLVPNENGNGEGGTGVILLKISHGPGLLVQRSSIICGIWIWWIISRVPLMNHTHIVHV